MHALAWCNRTQCLQIAEWLEYTPFPPLVDESVRLCIANNADHTLAMSGAACPGADIYTCFDCKLSDAVGCGVNQCGDRSAGICSQGRCECYPGFTFEADTGACEIEH